MTDIKKKKEQDELLIELVQSHSILYDAAHINYKNNILKHKVWEEIAQILKIPGKCFLLYYDTNIVIIIRVTAKRLFLMQNINNPLIHFSNALQIQQQFHHSSSKELNYWELRYWYRCYL